VISSAPVQLQLILPSMARLDLTDEERDELVRALRGIVDNDRFSLSPRVRALRRILAKLEPPPLAAEPYPPPKPPGEPSLLYRKLKGGGRRR